MSPLILLTGATDYVGGELLKAFAGGRPSGPLSGATAGGPADRRRGWGGSGARRRSGRGFGSRSHDRSRHRVLLGSLDGIARILGGRKPCCRAYLSRRLAEIGGPLASHLAHNRTPDQFLAQFHLNRELRGEKLCAQAKDRGIAFDALFTDWRGGHRRCRDYRWSLCSYVRYIRALRPIVVKRRTRRG